MSKASRYGWEGAETRASGYSDRSSRPYSRRSVSPPLDGRYARRRGSRGSDEYDGRYRDRYADEHDYRGRYIGPSDSYRRDRDDRGVGTGSVAGSARPRVPSNPVDHKGKGRDVDGKHSREMTTDTERPMAMKQGAKRKREEEDDGIPLARSMSRTQPESVSLDGSAGRTAIYIPPNSTIRPVSPQASKASQTSSQVAPKPPQFPPPVVNPVSNAAASSSQVQRMEHIASSSSNPPPSARGANAAPGPSSATIPSAALGVDATTRQLSKVIKGIYQASQCEDRVVKTKTYLTELIDLRDKPNQAEEDLAEYPALIEPAEAAFAEARSAQVQAVTKLKGAFNVFLSNALAGLTRAAEPKVATVQNLMATSIPQELLKSAIKALEVEKGPILVPQAQPAAVDVPDTHADSRMKGGSRRTKARFEELDSELEAMRFAMDELEQRVEGVESKGVEGNGGSGNKGMEGVTLEGSENAGLDKQELLALKVRLQALAKERATDLDRMDRLELMLSAKDDLLGTQQTLMDTVQQQVKDMMESHARLLVKFNIAQQDSKKGIAAESADREKLRLAMVAGREELNKRDNDLQEGITQNNVATSAHLDVIQDEIASYAAAIEESNKIKAAMPTAETLRPLWTADISTQIIREKLLAKKEEEEARKKAATVQQPPPTAAASTSPKPIPVRPPPTAPAYRPQSQAPESSATAARPDFTAGSGSLASDATALTSSSLVRPAPAPLSSRIRPPTAAHNPGPGVQRPPLSARIDAVMPVQGQSSTIPKKTLADRMKAPASDGAGAGLSGRISSPGGR